MLCQCLFHTFDALRFKKHAIKFLIKIYLTNILLSAVLRQYRQFRESKGRNKYLYYKFHFREFKIIKISVIYTDLSTYIDRFTKFNLVYEFGTAIFIYLLIKNINTIPNICIMKNKKTMNYYSFNLNQDLLYLVDQRDMNYCGNILR